jgi:predicted amidophosphoribosyltransferase
MNALVLKVLKRASSVAECAGCRGFCMFPSAFCPCCFHSVKNLLYNRHHIPRLIGDVPAYSAGPYEPVLKNYLFRIKNSQFPSQSSLEFLIEILSYWSSELQILEATSLVAVPRSPFHSYGHFDLARFIALTLSTHLKIPILQPAPSKDILNDFWFGPQKNKSLKDREETPPLFNVAARTSPRRAKILVVDDLCSTGASFQSMQFALQKRGHDCVGFFALLNNPQKK